MRRRKNCHMLQRGNEPPAQRIHLGDPVDFIPKKFHPDQIIAALSRIDFQHVAAHPETASSQVHVVPVILDADQLPDHRVPVLRHSRSQGNDLVLIFVRAAQTIDTGHAGNNHHVPALRQGSRGRQAEFVDLVVDGRILRNIGIRGRHISLRLVIIVVGDKILHRVLREELLKLPVKLSRQCFIVGDHQRGPLQLLDDIGHGEGLAGPRNTQ